MTRVSILRLFSRVALMLVVGCVVVSEVMVILGTQLPIPSLLYKTSGIPLEYPSHYICIFDPNIGQRRCIVDDLETRGGFAVSPDGSQIAFTYDAMNGQNYYLLKSDLAGRNREWVLDVEVRDPAWSPDGEYIAFSTYDGREHTSIFLVDGYGTVNELFSDRFSVSHPTWSHDGIQLAVVVSNIDEQRIIVIDRQGSFIAEVVNNLTGELQDATFCDVVWTPDGNIIFSSHHTGIFLYDFESRSLKNLIHEEFVCQLSLSYDGQWLAYNVHEFSWSDNRSGIYIMSLDGNLVTRLTDGRNDFFPAWIP